MIANVVWLLALVLIAGFLAITLRRISLNKNLDQLRKVWGKIPDYQITLKDARLLFDLDQSNSETEGYLIDDDSWRDLDLDEIFTQINRTSTPTGGQCLYYLLRHPSHNEKLLNEREILIEHFSSNQQLREKLQMALQSISRVSARNIPRLLWEPLPIKPAWANYIPILSLAAMAALGLVLSGILHFSFLLGLFFINFVIRVFVKRKIDDSIHAFEFLGDLISCAKKISSLKSEQLSEIQETFKKNLSRTKSIEKIIFAVQYNDSLAVMDYINSYFLWDISGFYSALNKVNKQLEELRNLYHSVGYLDAMIAVASYRQEYSQFCQPKFTTDLTKYSVDDIYNPLLKTPVTNSFTFDQQDYIITGSNMSGKTTFIKTMGVNAILSQTIHTCLASRYEVPLLRVITSIAPEDSLLDGKSYFMAEVESILRLINASKSKAVHLFILDEIYRGTNSVERQAMSIEVLKYLANNKDFVLVATHDMQLSEGLGDNYQNIHFQEEVGDNGLTFDYQLRFGPSTTRNAIALLKHVGYPDEISDNAIKRLRESSF